MGITNDDVQFWGSNIPNEVKQIIESANESVCNSFDNDTQRQAYLLGVENTLSVLKQMLQTLWDIPFLIILSLEMQKIIIRLQKINKFNK